MNSRYHALSALQGLNPDFISVTYGASGGAGTSDTLNIASSIRTWTHQIIQYDQCDPDRLTNPAGIDPDTCGNGIKWCMVGAYNLFYREGNRVYTDIPAYQQAVA